MPLPDLEVLMGIQFTDIPFSLNIKHYGCWLKIYNFNQCITEIVVEISCPQSFMKSLRKIKRKVSSEE